MSKKLGMLFVTFVLATVLFGCAKAREEDKTANSDTALQNESKNMDEAKTVENDEDVELVVWGAEEDEALLQQITESFQEEYKGQANFDITIAAQSESGCKDVLLGDLEAGADVFAFADDQLNALVAAGALEPIENADQLKSECLPGAIQAASVADVLYAYPLTADNGYFFIIISNISMRKM